MQLHQRQETLQAWLMIQETSSMQCAVCMQLYQQQKTLQAQGAVQKTSNTQKLETKAGLRGLHLSWRCAT